MPILKCPVLVRESCKNSFHEPLNFLDLNHLPRVNKACLHKENLQTDRRSWTDRQTDVTENHYQRYVGDN